MQSFKEFLVESDDLTKQIAALERKYKTGTRVQFVGAKSGKGTEVISPPVKPSEKRKGTVTGITSSALLNVKWDGGKRNSKVAPGTVKIVKE